MDILAHPTLLSLWVLLLVVAIEAVWQWPVAYHPLTFVRLVAEKMALKVHPSTKRTEYQQRLSGALALLVLVLPWSIIFALFLTLAEYPQFFEGVLLLVALQYQQFAIRARKIHGYLLRDKKQLAKDTLQPMVLRETQNLSALGVAKATCESSILRFSYQYVCVIFWYCLVGGVFSLVVRLIYEFSQSWNTKLSKFKHFGYATASIHKIVNWLPVRLTLLLFAFAQNLSGTVKGSKTNRGGSSSHGTLLAGAGGAIDAELGGPAYYAGIKVRLPKVGSSKPLRLDHIKLTAKMLSISRVLLVGLCVLFFCISYAVSMQLKTYA